MIKENKLNNLALACRRCNELCYNFVAGYDSETKAVVPLFRGFQLKKYPIPAGRYANALRAGEQGAGSKGRDGRFDSVKLDNLFSGSPVNPRQQNSSEHFLWSANGRTIIRVTLIGRVSCKRLDLNDECYPENDSIQTWISHK